MYAIQNITTGEFIYGTNFAYGAGGNTQNTSRDQMLTYQNLQSAKRDFIYRECDPANYRVVKLKPIEIDQIIDLDSSDGYNYY